MSVDHCSVGVRLPAQCNRADSRTGAPINQREARISALVLRYAVLANRDAEPGPRRVRHRLQAATAVPPNRPRHCFEKRSMLVRPAAHRAYLRRGYLS